MESDDKSLKVGTPKGERRQGIHRYLPKQIMGVPPKKEANVYLESKNWKQESSVSSELLSLLWRQSTSHSQLEEAGMS